MAQWRAKGLPDSFDRLAINISARQFSQDDFALKVEAFTKEANIRALSAREASNSTLVAGGENTSTPATRIATNNTPAVGKAINRIDRRRHCKCIRGQ